MRPRLGVNVDHVATVRQARRAAYPDPVEAALVAERAGADQITVHLREDRRHIQERDVSVLRKVLKHQLNLEMAATDEMAKFALEIRPDVVTLVPERREELTTEGGLDVAARASELRPIVKLLRDADIRVSLFIDPDLDQVKASHKLDVHSSTAPRWRRGSGSSWPRGTGSTTRTPRTSRGSRRSPSSTSGTRSSPAPSSTAWIARSATCSR
jgi:pyridoxine 5'-phosphate synthase